MTDTISTQSAMLERIEALRTDEGVEAIRLLLRGVIKLDWFDYENCCVDEDSLEDAARAVVAHILGEG